MRFKNNLVRLVLRCLGEQEAARFGFEHGGDGILLRRMAVHLPEMDLEEIVGIAFLFDFLFSPCGNGV